MPNFTPGPYSCLFTKMNLPINVLGGWVWCNVMAQLWYVLDMICLWDQVWGIGNLMSEIRICNLEFKIFK